MIISDNYLKVVSLLITLSLTVYNNYVKRSIKMIKYDNYLKVVSQILCY